MSNYKYSMRDYHAIESANIKIDGITVISGENGCGKSTLSRWLYYVVNGASEFSKLLYQQFISNLQRILSILGSVYGDIQLHRTSSSFLMVSDGRRLLNELASDESEENVAQALSIYNNIIDRFGKLLSEYLSETHSKAAKDRVLRFLGMEPGSGFPISRQVSEFIFSHKKQGDEIYKQYVERKEKRDISQFFSLLQYHYDIRELIPEKKIDFYEDKVNLFKNNQVGYLYNLNLAIYVDTPMSVSEDVAEDNIFWENLQRLMIYPKKGRDLTREERKLIYRLQKLIRGSVSAEKDDFDQLELRYRREDGLDIKLDDVATGIKSFSYILRLIENGYLDENTLLLIDEPEAHLHPQWVVEFARVLVLLNKELGVKIMIASHHPDMVAAIHSISKKEEVDDTTVFYLAIPADNSFRYVYGELGNSVEEIFKSFNIAYDRIRQYGE